MECILSLFLKLYFILNSETMMIRQDHTPVLSSRSRSFSESQSQAQRSSRAEKRMGRLFRQNTTTANSSNNLKNNQIDEQPLTILSLSKQYVMVYQQMKVTIQSLNLNQTLQTNNIDSFIEVIENTEKHLSTKLNDDMPIDYKKIKTYLSTSLSSSIQELKKVINILKTSIKSQQQHIPIFLLRSTFYNLFSMFIELSNIAQTLTHISESSTLSNSSSISTNNNINNILNSQSTNKSPASDSSTTFIPEPKLDRQHSDLASDNDTSGDNTNNNNNNNNNSTTDSLFNLILQTIQAAQTVYTQIDDAISKNSINENESLDPFLDIENTISKIKELKYQCVASMEQTKRVRSLLKLYEKNSNTSNDFELNKNIYEQTNIFLKSIINILAATKAAITNVPTLNDVRSSLSILTRASKELTIKLESSSLKKFVINNTPSNTTLIEQPNLSSIPSLPSIPSIHDTQQDDQPVLMKKHSILKKIPEQDESSLGLLKQHIKNLEINTNFNNNMNNNNEPDNDAMVMHTPLAVTTPLIASIGPAVASAVLPIKSPLKMANNNNGTFNINDAFEQNNNSMESEYNPFENLIPKDQ